MNHVDTGAEEMDEGFAGWGFDERFPDDGVSGRVWRIGIRD